MPTKNINMDWDIENPNERVPAHEPIVKPQSPIGESHSEAKDLELNAGGPGNTRQIEISTKAAAAATTDGTG